jgi:hypothetical protein
MQANMRKRIVASNTKDNNNKCEKKLLEKKVRLELQLMPLLILVLFFFQVQLWWPQFFSF